MKTLEMIGYNRNDLGKKAAKDLRSDASVPCVLYGGEKHVLFHSPMILFRDLVYTPEVHIVNMDIEGDEYKCILQDITFHPVSEVILHADFLEIKEDKPVKMDIPVSYHGTSPGVQVGGKLVPKLKKIKVKALPKDLPDTVIVDISKLELGKSIKVKEIVEDNFQILNAGSTPVVSVEVPRALRGKQATDAK
jgi:large subunit ribosomal protein L25